MVLEIDDADFGQLRQVVQLVPEGRLLRRPLLLLLLLLLLDVVARVRHVRVEKWRARVPVVGHRGIIMHRAGTFPSSAGSGGRPGGGGAKSAGKCPPRVRLLLTTTQVTITAVLEHGPRRTLPTCEYGYTIMIFDDYY